MGLGEGALAGLGREHRGVKPLGDGGDFGAGVHGAAADVEQRRVGVRQQRRGLVHGLGRRRQRGRVQRLG